MQSTSSDTVGRWSKQFSLELNGPIEILNRISSGSESRVNNPSSFATPVRLPGDLLRQREPVSQSSGLRVITLPSGSEIRANIPHGILVTGRSSVTPAFSSPATFFSKSPRTWNVIP